MGLRSGTSATDDLDVQPNLTVNEPGDKYEEEAERVADAVMRMPDPKLTADTQEQLPADRIQRMCPRYKKRRRQGQPLDCPDCEAELQRKKQSERAMTIDSQAPRQIQSLRGGGKLLSESVRSFFEPRFGRDFSDVRVHTGPTADEAARSVNAEAFTVGQDIAFRSGVYRPMTENGKKLLAHELTHVVQQGKATVRSNRISNGSSPLKTELGPMDGGAAVQRAYGIVRGKEGSRRPQPTPSVTIDDETTRRPTEEEEVALKRLGVDGRERTPDIQRTDGDAPPSRAAKPSLTLSPGATVTRGDSLTAEVDFNPTAGERIKVTNWEYIAPRHGTVTRPTSDADFQKKWEGTMALSGTIRLEWHYLPPDTVVETLEQPVTVENRTGTIWSSDVTLNGEKPLKGQPSPPRKFKQLGNFSGNLNGPSLTDSTINNGPNKGFTFVSTLSEGNYTATPKIHPDVTKSSSQFRKFHRDGSVLFKVSKAGGTKTRIPTSDYSNLQTDPLTWKVPNWENFYKKHNIYTIMAKAGNNSITVRDSNWRLARNARDAQVKIVNHAQVRGRLGIGQGQKPSYQPQVNYSWEGYPLMASDDIPQGVRSHEFGHNTHSHWANFDKTMEALDPQKIMERTVSTPSSTINFSQKVKNLMNDIKKSGETHKIVDKDKSAQQEQLVVVSGKKMAGINEDPNTGKSLGNIWNLQDGKPMRNS